LQHPRTEGIALSQANYLFTSESVSEGHPDKVSDRISDAVLDRFLGTDPINSRLGCETFCTTNRIIVGGEGRCVAPMVVDGKINAEEIEAIARACVKEIGYEQDGFHWKNADVQVYLHAQSADIAQGVDSAGNKDEGAGDQGIMFGYACRETEELMPAPIHFSHAILRSLAEARHSGAEPGLGPDSKSQVTLLYENGKPVKATSVVVSTQHNEDLTQEQIREIVRPHVVNVLPDGWMCDEAEFYVNPTGRFVIGGPDSDAGLTGRKIIVDTYGGAAPHGGGAFSGKDPSKVDRSATYAARYLAKNVVAAGLAERCVIQLSYAIGVSKPLSVYIDTQGTGRVEEARLSTVLQDMVDLSPRGIREHLELNKPIYARTSAYGHFGRAPDPDGGFSWERTDLVDALKSEFGAG
jgi:S-adenosylmethionine synthetase